MALLLLTGFEGFLGRRTNPSWDGLAVLFNAHPDLRPDVATLRLPVAYARAGEALSQAIELHRPAAVLSFGMHGGAESGGRDPRGFYVERRAHNLDDAAARDNDGEQRRDRPIRPDMPADASIAGTLPPQVLHAAITGAAHLAHFSDNAGRYLCNHVFFHALSAAVSYKPRPLAGFVHVPPGQELISDGLPNHAFTFVAASLARAVLGHLRGADRHGSR